MINLKAKAIDKSSFKKLLKGNKEIKAFEKLDGVKLSIFKFNEELVISYKNTLYFKEEFQSFTYKTKELIRKSSINNNQFLLIFDQLIDLNIDQIPSNMEFFIEFIQNKPTLTRTYDQKHKLFLIAYGQPFNYDISGNTVFGSSEKIYFDRKKLRLFSKLLNIDIVPQLFDKKIRSELFRNTLKDQKRKFHNIYEALYESCKTFPSILGGKSEGAILKVEETDQLFKIVKDDQYNIKKRDEKKNLYRSTIEKENEYWEEIRKEIFNMLLEMSEKVQKKVYDQIFNSTFNIYHEKKNSHLIKEDIASCSKNYMKYMKHVNKKTKKVAIIPLAAKPFHLGHWKLMKFAESKSDLVLLFVSTKRRKRKGQIEISSKALIEYWKVIKEYLSRNVKVIYTQSPILEIRRFLRVIDPEQIEFCPQFLIFSDEIDIEKNFSKRVIEKEFEKLYLSSKLQTVYVNRNSFCKISGTGMRKFIEYNNKGSFQKFLPPFSQKYKEIVWKFFER